jgi:hypothetical protein
MCSGNRVADLSEMCMSCADAYIKFYLYSCEKRDRPARWGLTLRYRWSLSRVNTIFQALSHLLGMGHFLPIFTYMHNTRQKNDQVVAILMKTGLNNALLPTLFTVVHNIEQYCYTRFRLNNIVQYCWQVWTTWAAKHCSILLSSGLGIFCHVIMNGIVTKYCRDKK